MLFKMIFKILNFYWIRLVRAIVQLHVVNEILFCMTNGYILCCGMLLRCDTAYTSIFKTLLFCWRNSCLEANRNMDYPVGVGDHCLTTGPSVVIKSMPIVAREQQWQHRKVQDTIYIKQRQVPLQPTKEQRMSLKNDHDLQLTSRNVASFHTSFQCNPISHGLHH